MEISHVQSCTREPENTGYTYALSSSYSSSALSFEREHNHAPVFELPRMSRRSLRLNTLSGRYGDESLLDQSLNQSITFNTSVSSRRESRMLRSRKDQQSASLLITPLKSQVNGILQSSIHSCTNSDTSMLSSLLDESCVQEHTLVDSFWEQTMPADCSTYDSSVLPVTSNALTAQTQTSAMHSYLYQDCHTQPECKDAVTTYSAAHRSRPVDSSVEPTSTVYSRKHRTGALASSLNSCMCYSRKAVAFLLSPLALLVQTVVLKWQKGGTMKSIHEAAYQYSRRPYTSLVCLVVQLAQTLVWRVGYRGKVKDGGCSSYNGKMNGKDSVTGDEHQSVNGPLCDECKVKQNTETRAVPTLISWTFYLLGALGHIISYSGSCSLAALRTLGSGSTIGMILSRLWSTVLSPGLAMSGVYWWFSTRWYQLVTVMSLLNAFLLTRCRTFSKLLLLLLVFVLLMALCYSGMLLLVPTFNLSTREEMPRTPNPAPDSSQRVVEMMGSPDAVLPLSASQDSDDLRLSLMEQRVGMLWDGVQQGSQRQELLHQEVLESNRNLQRQLEELTDPGKLGLKVSELLEQRLQALQGQLSQKHLEGQQHGSTSHVTEIETRLQELEAKTEMLLQKRETVPAVPISESRTSLYSPGLDREAHHTLLAQVQRLETELDHLRDNLQGLVGCQGHCEHLGSLQSSVTAQVKQELRTLFSSDKQMELSKPLFGWLSAQFVRGSDLQAMLSALELSILRNISQHLENTQEAASADTVAQALVNTGGNSGMSEEQVQHIVQNALKLFSQDRIGLVDYALESGGGSILSTRCSETFHSKTALLSLFSIPLWYFSQSPRAVIQPDVHPGNCWAFKGSQGYVVIRLSLRVVPSAFSVEHIPKVLSPTRDISSAPRQFAVYGLDHENQDEGKLLGVYTYQEEKDSLQTFPVSEENEQAFQIIELRVLSNWGHPDYTCLYRFRVHGEPEAR